uniref:Uncharacterized protein n=1 Tax=Peromyscus maniculatus bairdii TaxID=230844 RepID=A0A8C8W5J8_PERMB
EPAVCMTLSLGKHTSVTEPIYHSGNLRMEHELTDPLCSGLGSSCAAFVSNLMTKMHVRVPVLHTSDRVGAARDAFMQILFSGAVCTQKISECLQDLI